MERYSADKDRLTGVDVPGGNAIHNGGPKVKTNDECLCFWGLEIAWGGLPMDQAGTGASVLHFQLIPETMVGSNNNVVGVVFFFATDIVM